MAKEDPPRYDVMVLLQNPRTVVGEGIAATLLRFYAASRVITPVAEALHKDWTEVYCEPGPSAHEPFHKGTYEGTKPVFKECCFRWGTSPVNIDVGTGELPVFFYLEFRGCLFKDPLGPFRKRFKEIMRSAPRIGQQDHTELPPHKEVDPEDAPKDKRLKKGDRGGQAGTTVEEW